MKILEGAPQALLKQDSKVDDDAEGAELQKRADELLDQFKRMIQAIDSIDIESISKIEAAVGLLIEDAAKANTSAQKRYAMKFKEAKTGKEESEGGLAHALVGDSEES